MKRGYRGAVLMALLLCAGQAQASQNDCQALGSARTALEGQSVPCTTDLNRNLRTTAGTFEAGENSTAQALTQIYTSDSGIPIRYTSTGDKNVVTGRATESVQITAWSGTSVTAIIYDTASGACNTGTQITGTIALTNNLPVKLSYRHNNGFCVTIGGTSPDVTVVYK